MASQVSNNSICWLTASPGPEWLRFQFCDAKTLANLGMTNHAVRTMIQIAAPQNANALQVSRFCYFDSALEIFRMQNLFKSLSISPSHFTSLRDLTLQPGGWTTSHRSYSPEFMNAYRMITDTMVQHFDILPSLETLDLSHISATSVTKLLKITPKLNHFSCSCKLNNEMIELLKQKKSLHSLGFTDSNKFRFNHSFSFLKKIEFTRLDNLIDTSCQVFAKNLQLENLVFSYCKNIPSKGIQAFLTPKLLTLDISDCEPMDEDLPQVIIEHALNLTECDLTNPRPLTPRFLYPFLAAEKLQVLLIQSPSYDPSLSEELVQELALTFKTRMEANHHSLDDHYLCLSIDKVSANIFDEKFEAFCRGETTSFLPQNPEDESKED